MGNAAVAPMHHLAGESSFRHGLAALLALDGGLALCVGVHGSASTHTEPHGTYGCEWTSGCHAYRPCKTELRRKVGSWLTSAVHEAARAVSAIDV